MKKSNLLCCFLCFVLCLLLPVPQAQANYWEIDYTPNEVAVLQGADIVTGDGDDIASVLTAMGCRHVVLDYGDLANLPQNLKVLFIEGSPEFFDASGASAMTSNALVLQFVRDGGHVFVTGKADFLMDAFGSGSDIGMYKPNTRRPVERIYPGLNPPPVNMNMTTRGELKNHMQLDSLYITYPTRFNEHSIMNLESVTYTGSTAEMTTQYGAQWPDPSLEAVGGWDIELMTAITSFIFPFGQNGGSVHYVTYRLHSAYFQSGEVGKKLVEYQVPNVLTRAGLIPAELFAANTERSAFMRSHGVLEIESASSYIYRSGRGSVRFLPGASGATLTMNDLAEPRDLLVWRIDDDMVLSIKGTTGDVTIPEWFDTGAKLSGVRTAGGVFLPSTYLERNAETREPDIDITPVSWDVRVVPADEQIEIVGSGANDYLFGNAQDNVMRGKGGSNIYYYRLGEGHDEIYNTKEDGQRNVLRFHTDIVPTDITVRRGGDDMLFLLPGGSVAVKGWYEDTASRLDRVELYDGTYWDARDLEKLANGETLSARGHVANPLVIEATAAETPGSESSGTGGSGGCGALPHSLAMLALLVFSLFVSRRTSGWAKNISRFFIIMLAFVVMGASSLHAGTFVPPTASIGAEGPGRAAAVTLTPGYADMGTFTNSELRHGHTEVFGVKSSIENHSIFVEKIYAPTEEEHLISEIKPVFVSEIVPVVKFPLKIDLTSLTYIKIANVVFTVSDDLPVGHHEIKVMCDVRLPDELGGKVETTYVTYGFEIIEDVAAVDVDIIGEMIGSVEDSRYIDRQGNAITEQSLAQLKKEDIKPYRGFVADGNARLLVRFQAKEPKDVSLSIPQLSSLGIKVETLDRKPCDISSLTFQKMSDELYQTTLVLIAPPTSEFSDDMLVAGAKDEFKFFTRVVCDGEYGSFPIYLRRTPVVLVHGIWSSEEAFYIEKNHEQLEGEPLILNKGIKGALSDNGFYVHSFSYDNWKGPSEVISKENDDFYKYFIKPVFDNMKKAKIECTRVDIVGHSMGGMMAKQFSRYDEWNKTNDSYNEGTIRRLVSLGSPHWGSPFPSYLKKDMRYLEHDYFALNLDYPELPADAPENLESARRCSLTHFGREAIIIALTAFGNKMGSAIDDLVVCSPLIQELNAEGYDFSMHVIAGDCGDDKLVFGSQALSFGTDVLMGLYDHKDLFVNITELLRNGNFVPEHSDTVVGVSSALWEGTGLDTSILSDIANDLEHQGMGLNEKLANTVKDLLIGPSDKFSIPQTANLSNITYRSETNSARAEQILDNIEQFVPKESIALYANIDDTVLPGAQVSFSAIVDDTSQVKYMVIVDQDLNEQLMQRSGNTFTCTLKIPILFCGERLFMAYAFTEDAIIVSNTAPVFVKPDMSKLSMLKFFNGEQVIFSEGVVFSPLVYGVFSDGTEYNLSDPRLGTTLSSSNPVVAEIVSGDTVHGLEIGETEITATNGDVGAVLYLEIVESVTSKSDVPTQGKSGGGVGCNSGATPLALLLVCASLAMRRTRSWKKRS